MTLLCDLESALRRSHEPFASVFIETGRLWASGGDQDGNVLTSGDRQAWLEGPQTVSLSPALPVLPEEFIKSMCDVQDRIPEVSRFSEDHGYVHVSSLSDLCARQYAIARQYDVEVQISPTGANRIVWEIGNSLERHVLRNVERYHGHMQTLRGEQFVDEEYRIVGRPDALVRVADEVAVVVEVKTMNIRDWERLERPLQEHVFQAAMYRWLMQRCYPDHLYSFQSESGQTGTTGFLYPHSHVILLYVAKDFTRGSPYKEFHIDVGEIITRRNVEIALEAAAELRQVTEADRIPRRTQCTRIDCARARECAVSHLCFNLPAEGT